MDKGASIRLIGITTLFKQDGDVYDLEVQYPNDTRGHIWHYYFDKKTFLLRATQVAHDGKTSIIFNDSTEKATGLNLNKNRSSYRINEDGTLKRLLADYDYQITCFESTDN